jgi:nuclear pore complex protein Nup205
MASISRLRYALYNALFNVQFDEQELFDELLVQKSRLLNLLNVGPRSAGEQKEITSGLSLRISVALVLMDLR